MISFMKLLIQFLLIDFLVIALSCDTYLDIEAKAETFKTLLNERKEDRLCISLSNTIDFELSNDDILLRNSITIIRFAIIFSVYSKIHSNLEETLHSFTSIIFPSDWKIVH